MLKPLFWLGRRLAHRTCPVGRGRRATRLQQRWTSRRRRERRQHGRVYVHGGQYDQGTRSDPINIVFYQGATNQDIAYYLGLEDDWSDNGGETQYFRMYNNCYEMDGMKASGKLQLDRYHGRYHRGLDANGNVALENPFVDYSIANAHYEEIVVGGDCGLGNHVVPQNGFNEGRDDVVWDWTQESPPNHFYASYGDWHNTEHIRQCNDNYAWSNGQVAVIRAATGNVEGMSLSPDPANLWVCWNSPSHHCNPWAGEGVSVAIDSLGNQSGIGLGGYSFDTFYTPSLISVDAVEGSLLDSTGRSVSCSEERNSGYTSFECQSSGEDWGAG